MLAKKIIVGLGIGLIFPFVIYYGVHMFFPSLDVNPGYLEDNIKFIYFFFLVSIPAGIISLILGANTSNIPVGTGLMLGGFLTFFWGIFLYGRYLESWVMFTFLILILLALLSIGYRKFRRVQY